MNIAGVNNSLIYHGGSPNNCMFQKPGGGTDYEYNQLYAWGTSSMSYEMPLYQGASHLQASYASKPDRSTEPYEGMDCQTLCPIPPHDDGKIVSLTLSIARAATRSDLPVEYPCYAGICIFRSNLDEFQPQGQDRARSIIEFVKFPIPDPTGGGSNLKVANLSQITNSMLLPGDGGPGGRYQIAVDIPVKKGWYLGASVMNPEWLPTELCRSLVQDLNVYHDWDEYYRSMIGVYHNIMLSFKFKPDV